MKVDFLTSYTGSDGQERVIAEMNTKHLINAYKSHRDHYLQLTKLDEELKTIPIQKSLQNHKLICLSIRQELKKRNVIK